jgi:hypothetical protein
LSLEMVGAAVGSDGGVLSGVAVGSGAEAGGAVGSPGDSVGAGSDGCSVEAGGGEAVGSSARARAGRSNVPMSSSA